MAASGDRRAARALEALREQALPSTLGTVEGVDYAVAGKSAMPYDSTEQVNSRTPIVFAFVLGLAFLLLAVTFRSWTIPLVPSCSMVFMTLSAIEYKMLGLGMACAILIEATVVRGVLLPAAMNLLGDPGVHTAGSAPTTPGRVCFPTIGP
ncbi:MMPL family transporter [Streptomyces sp. NPDC057136]|uniref:MMPL family transporter n=1 Tax=Streptomyces sp. NPDC057136 TaxID=3346029 RepID=UPI0036436C99